MPMALTCSVLGHAFGDPTTERDREERGSEVVVTVREYETCRRCGTTRVVSENKEVTAVEGEAEPITDRRTDVDVADGDGPQAAVEPVNADDPAPDTGEAATPPAQGAPADEDSVGATVPDAEPAAAADAEGGDDGAEIMDAEAGEPVDEELASPSVADPADPDVAGSADADAEPTEDEDAVVMGEDEAGVERAPGEWPEEEDGSDAPDWSPPEEDVEAEPEPDVDHSPGHTITVPEGEFHCEECGYSTPVESSSLRAGDFCPECHRGTLSHVRE